jgi:hypothetical protein
LGRYRVAADEKQSKETKAALPLIISTLPIAASNAGL